MIGTCYQFSSDISDLNALCSEDLYEANLIGPDDKAICQESSKQAVNLAGVFTTNSLGSVERLTGDEPGYKITTPGTPELEKAKQSYFAAKFATFQYIAKNISIDQFIQHHNEAMLKLETCINDRNHDHVAFFDNRGMSAMPLDSFIRKLEPNTIYYLSETTITVT